MKEWTDLKAALLSAYHKDGLAEFGRGLVDLGYDLIATGSTAKTLSAAGLAVTSVEELTQSPEVMGGRVKTLHPRVHGGILFRRGEAQDREDLGLLGGRPIDLVCINLYPFRNHLEGDAAAIELIDIGGPAMLRAAAKNFQDVIAVCDPAQYRDVLTALRAGGPTLDERRSLAARAFACTAALDMDVAAYLSGLEGFAAPQLQPAAQLRYGENPQQHAWLLTSPAAPCPYVQVAGETALSYNNVLDACSAAALAGALGPAAAAVIKHQMPSGAAALDDPALSLRAAIAADSEAAFGGIVAVRGALTEDIVDALHNLFVEVLVVEDSSEATLRAFIARHARTRVLHWRGAWQEAAYSLRLLPGGALLQQRDPDDDGSGEDVVAAEPLDARDLHVGWQTVRYARSNAIVLAKDGRTVGIGQGQVSRARAALIALQQAGDAARGAVLCSDAFLPFGDVAQLAAEAGVAGIVQPGGSRRDDETIAICKERGMALRLTGRRHFRHS